MSSKRLNETTLHELDVIDAIVRGGGEARPEDAALTDFALLVRNARPVPNHGEAAALDERAAAGRAPRAPRERLIFKPVFAGICVLVLLVGVSGVAYVKSSGQSATSASGPPMLGLTENAASGVPASAPDSNANKLLNQALKDGGASTLPPPSAAPITSAKEPRDVARDTRLTLAADGGEIERLSDRVNAIIDHFGGYVANSNVRAGEGDRGRATFELMIPASQYKPALAALSRLAHVRSRSQSSVDITTQANRAERQVTLLTARVKRLTGRLAAAETTGQRIVLRRQLAVANAQLRAAAGAVRSNRARVNYVPVALTIVADKAAADKDKGAIAKAFDNAGKILTSIAAVLIVALAVVIPLALILAAFWFGLRRWSRARAQRTIDAAVAVQSE